MDSTGVQKSDRRTPYDGRARQAAPLRFDGFEFVAVELTFLLDTAGDAHHPRFENQSAVAFVGFRKKNRFESAALILKRAEHHVAKILGADVAKGDQPAEKSETAVARARGGHEFVAPGFAVTGDEIERMAGDADFEEFLLVAETEFGSVVGEGKRERGGRGRGGVGEEGRRRRGRRCEGREEIQVPEEFGTRWALHHAVQGGG